MCGITGFAGKTYNRALLAKMNSALFHRGPDEEGIYLGQGIGLAMRRLSIIDVKSGHQPMSNEDGTIRIIFNGEIYNFMELRKELIQKGYRFRTHHSDTEVIVHAYQEYGEDFVNKLNGMFAIAIWDEPKKKLVLYRDRIGEKPLYFWHTQNQIFFASEIKALLTLPFFDREVNEKALFYYLSLKHSPREHCFFEGIQSLDPGEKLVFQNGRVNRSLYWQIDATKPLKISEADAAEELLKLLKSSVRYRMISDVRLGAYLSGGVDSSAVVGLMSRQIKKPVETFSLTYSDNLPNKAQDELWAARMAKKFHTKHRIYRMKAKEFIDDFDHIVESFDEPFGGTISTYFLSKLIRKHVTVAISGDGADELFGSYKAHRLAYPMMHLANFIKKGINLHTLTAAQKKLLAPFDNQIDYLLKLHSQNPAGWHSRLGVFSDQEKNDLFAKSTAKNYQGESISGYFKKAYKRCASTDPLNQVLQMECQNLLPDQVLTFVDRLSMAHSIEVRPPFLDHRIIEFAFRLPGTMKIKNGINKYILKKAVSGLLPQQLLHRPKEGFILPYHFWMQKYMCDKIKRVLSPKAIDEHGYFNKASVAKLLAGYQGGDLSQSNKVYLLLMFQVWWQKYIKNQ